MINLSEIFDSLPTSDKVIYEYKLNPRAEGWEVYREFVFDLPPPFYDEWQAGYHRRDERDRNEYTKEFFRRYMLQRKKLGALYKLKLIKLVTNKRRFAVEWRDIPWP